MHSKRQSLREKRSAQIAPLKTSASDSEISYATSGTYTELASEETNKLDARFPESPDDLTEWITRRSRADAERRVPVSEYVLPNLGEQLASDPAPRYELDSVPLPSPMAHGDALPRTVVTSQWDSQPVRHGDGADDGGASFEEAMRRSQQDTFRPPRRTNTGTDLDELELAVKMSLSSL